MANLKIGVLGLGLRGYLASVAHQPLDGFELAAVCDKRPDRLKKFCDKYKIDAYQTTDMHELFNLDFIDAVIILTPDFMHEEHAVAALEAGKAVYLEKPLEISIEGCDRILEAAKRTGSKLYLGHNMRHFPVVLKMKEIIDSGRIGRIQAIWCRHFISYGGDAYFKDWHSERKNINSLLLQKAAHDIDVIHWLANSYTASVVGMGKLSVYDQCERSPEENTELDWTLDNWPAENSRNFSPKIDIEDHSMIMMQLQNGIQCSYTQCHYTPDSVRNYTIIGDKGRMENVGDHGDCEIHVFTRRTDKYGSPEEMIRLSGEEEGHGGADPNIIKEFVQFVQEGIATNTNPVSARNSVAVGCKATESLRTDNGLKIIPPLSQELVDYFENGQI